MRTVTARFQGRVQGVGFRATVWDISQSFAVTGYVRNMLDGSVEVTAEDEGETLREFLEQIQQRLSRNIHDCSSDWSEVSEARFQSFEIGPDA